MNALAAALVSPDVIVAPICRWTRFIAAPGIVGALIVGFFVTAAHAQSQCDAPPYGDSVLNYRAFIKNTGLTWGHPEGVLSSLCRAKFEHIGRSTLYNLGFTDEGIDSKSTTDLAIQLLLAEKSLTDKPPD
jgi:hypothetical protein